MSLSIARFCLDLLPDLVLNMFDLPRGLPELLVSSLRARLDVVLERFDLDRLLDLEPPNRLG